MLTRCAVVFCAVAVSARATTITVTNTSDNGPGSLRQAIAIANDGDTISFAVTGSIVLTTGEFLLDKNITISGPGAANLVVDGNAGSRVFHVASGRTVSISGLTVTNGSEPADDGGGIYNDRATLTLDDCTISGNVAGHGGGLYNNGHGGGATLEINNSDLHGNTALHTGGGIYNNGSESGYVYLTINNSTLSNNSAQYGGGLYNDGFDSGYAIFTANTATFTGNAADFGGCIFNDSFAGSASATLNDSTLSGNSASEIGGCIYNHMADGFGTQTLNNSTLSGNSAGTSGGAIYNDQGIYFTINACAISDNSAQQRGGGVYNDGFQGIAWLTIDSSTFNGNSAAGGGGIFNDSEQQGSTRLQISNSTFSENAAGYGGGLASNGYGGRYVKVDISNSTFADNSATKEGGGIYHIGQNGRDTAIVTLTNTILKSGQSGSNIFCKSAAISSLGYNLSSDYCGGFLTGPGDHTNTDPMLGPLQDNGGPTPTHALLPGSPAIDAGDPGFASPPFYDQRGLGFNRVMNDRIDTGSFEVQGPAPTPVPRPTPTVRHPTAPPRPTPH